MSRGSAGPPTASVVVTTHDRPERAGSAIRSALAQTLEDIEVVVVDDGSDPPFVPDVDDGRLRLVRRDVSGGMCAARNDGLDAATGRWVVFLDDDDELEPQMLERALAAARASGLPSPVAVMTGMRFVDNDGEEVGRCHPATLVRGEHYLLEGRGDLRAKNALVMPTELVREIGGWDVQFEAFEADDFGIRLNRVASILALEDPLYRMTQHDGPRLTSRLAAIARDMRRTVVKHRDVFRQHRGPYAHYLSTIGVYELRSGHWGPAVRFCAAGLLRDPGRRRSWKYFFAALAGPAAVRLVRRLHPRESSVSFVTLNRRRLKKYGRRLTNYPRAAVAAPVAHVTRAVAIRRGRRSHVGSPTRALVCCVYRRRNAAFVRVLVTSPLAQGWDVRLWALDDVEPELAAYTIGTGPGAKFPLLNELVAGVAIDGYDWVVVVDDDVAFVQDDIPTFLAVAELAGLELAQPAHSELSHRDHDFTVRRPWSIARRTRFVEIGPVFAVARALVPAVLPFPAEHSMGWGLELEWHDLERRGARLGIVDAVAVRHLRPAGSAYATGVHRETLAALLAARDLDALADVQQSVGTWSAWQPRPSWASEAVPSSPG